MTAGAGHDLSTSRPQAVVRGQIRRRVATVSTGAGAEPQDPRMGRNMIRNSKSTIEE
jgi:hypothetical protein